MQSFMLHSFQYHLIIQFRSCKIERNCMKKNLKGFKGKVSGWQQMTSIHRPSSETRQHFGAATVQNGLKIALKLHFSLSANRTFCRFHFTAENFDQFSDPKPHDQNCFLLGFFEKDDDLKAEFMKSAAEMREKYKFVHTQSEEVMADKGHREYVSLTSFFSSFLKVFIFLALLG